MAKLLETNSGGLENIESGENHAKWSGSKI